jgi:hypothetical protein
MGRNTEGEKVVEAGARSVAYKPLPPPTTTDGVTQILFYQYVEPVWSARRQKQAIAEFHRLARENDCTGRGRIALEGVNCTLTAPAYGARRFCQGLRDWDPDLFNDTDFKLTDGVPGGDQVQGAHAQEHPGARRVRPRRRTRPTTQAKHRQAPRSG